MGGLMWRRPVQGQSEVIEKHNETAQKSLSLSYELQFTKSVDGGSSGGWGAPWNFKQLFAAHPVSDLYVHVSRKLTGTHLILSLLTLYGSHVYSRPNYYQILWPRIYVYTAEPPEMKMRHSALIIRKRVSVEDDTC